MLLGIYLAFSSHTDMTPVFTALGASAAEILQGEWYRCATALLVHSGPVHLLGNMVGLGLFGAAVCGITGAGVGLLMISVSGVLGNLLNAVLHQSQHLSVGASTAVFGAVGILVAHQVRHRLKKPGLSPWRVFLPLGAGLALLGLLSAGPQVDVMAHIFGMFSGGMLGALYELRRHRPPSRPVQVICAAATLSLFVAAWMIAGMGTGF